MQGPACILRILQIFLSALRHYKSSKHSLRNEDVEREASVRRSLCSWFPLRCLQACRRPQKYFLALAALADGSGASRRADSGEASTPPSVVTSAAAKVAKVSRVDSRVRGTRRWLSFSTSWRPPVRDAVGSRVVCLCKELSVFPRLPCSRGSQRRFWQLAPRLQN